MLDSLRFRLGEKQSLKELVIMMHYVSLSGTSAFRHVTQVIAAIDAKAEEQTGLLESANVAQTLAEQLFLVVGAIYQSGSLSITRPSNDGALAPLGARS